MIEVIDADGKKIRGVFRAENGALSVMDNVAFNKAMNDRERILNMQSKIDSLSEEIGEIKKMLQEVLISKINNK